MKQGCLVELIAPEYGLNDAPLLWHKTLTADFVSLGVVKCVLDSCLDVRRDKDRRVRYLILIEVDDLAVGSLASDKLKQERTARFKFGKWKD